MKCAIHFTAAAALACAAAFASTAALATPPPNGAEAFKHFDRGVKLAEEEDWASALLEFERAYDLDPDYRALFDIGQCHYQLHDYPAALSAFQRYLAEGKEAIAADRRAKVEADIKVLKGRVATLHVSSGVAGAEVLVDDVVVGTTPLAAPTVVSAGRHEIVLHREGAADVSREITIASEETAEITLDPIVPEAVAKAVPSTVGNGVLVAFNPAPSTLPAWLLFGAATASLGVGAYFGVTAIHGKNDLDRECAGKACPPSAQALISSSQLDGILSTVCTAVGAAAAVGGIAYVAIGIGGRKRDHGAATAFVIGPGWVAGKGNF
jgi:hypothetical protein